MPHSLHLCNSMQRATPQLVCHKQEVVWTGMLAQLRHTQQQSSNVISLFSSLSPAACCAMLCFAALCCAADPLVMENGQDLVTMCCHAYESPDSTEEDEEMVDYCKCQTAVLVVQLHHFVAQCSVGRAACEAKCVRTVRVHL